MTRAKTKGSPREAARPSVLDAAREADALRAKKNAAFRELGRTHPKLAKLLAR